MTTTGAALLREHDAAEFAAGRGEVGLVADHRDALMATSLGSRIVAQVDRHSHDRGDPLPGHTTSRPAGDDGAAFAGGKSDAALVDAYTTWLRANGTADEVARLDVLLKDPANIPHLAKVAKATRKLVSDQVPLPKPVLARDLPEHLGRWESDAMRAAAVAEALPFTDATQDAALLGVALSAALSEDPARKAYAEVLMSSDRMKVARGRQARRQGVMVALIAGVPTILSEVSS